MESKSDGAPAASDCEPKAFSIEYSTRWISPLPAGTEKASTAVEALRIIDELRERNEVIQHVRHADGSEVTLSQLMRIAKQESA